MENQVSNQVMRNHVVDIQKVLYTARTHVTGGRDGQGASDDGRLQIKLSTPGTSAEGTNPEQLFAAGWSACFIGAMKINAPKLGIKLPEGLAVDAEVDLSTAEGGYYLQARLNVLLPGLSIEQATELTHAAHGSCPYSKATNGNINVEINVAV